MYPDPLTSVPNKIAHRAQTASETPEGPKPEKWPAQQKSAVATFLVRRSLFCTFAYMAFPMTSEYDGLFYSERRSSDLGAFYLNSSVLQTSPNLGEVFF